MRGCNASVSVLPTGTVSLLFSDIEGSTALLKRLGPGYAAALDGQRRVLRKAWADHGGIELGTEGDSFYVVFATAEAAVAAAGQGQRDLAAFEWPEAEPVRVRMGIHTGAPAVHAGAYVGMDVHRAARIAAAAHGGQVLLSETTASLVRGCLPDGVSLKDLGSHTLKDIPEPQHLLQLAVSGLPADFPPVRTLGASSTLPRSITPLIGREGELRELVALVSSEQGRLVTLTGPGGSGKTRLAVAVAERLVNRFPDGVWFVPLAAVTTGDVMWTSIAEVLDVPPEGRIPPGFFDHVAHRSAVLVLDNLEQIADADNVVADLLDAAPQVVVLATSRRPLNLPGEHQHAVPPLELPRALAFDQVEQSGAVQLFVHHARAVKASFALSPDNVADVVEVCRRLDGLPLAIELVAARSKLLSPAALRARLDQALDIAAPGRHRPSRQQTLRDTIAWSYSLLPAASQSFLRRLGVFSGGADLEAVAAVTADLGALGDPLDIVADLVDASLAVIEEDLNGEPRVCLLETIRSYASEQASLAGELDTLHRLHAEHYLSLARELRRSVSGPEAQIVRGRMERELDNVREALAWSFDSTDAGTDRLRLGQELCADVGWVWMRGGYVREGTDWVSNALARRSGSLETRAANLYWLTVLLSVAGDYSDALAAALEEVEIARQLTDQRLLAEALGSAAGIYQQRGDWAAGRPLLEEALGLARASSDAQNLRTCLAVLFQNAVESEHFDVAAGYLEELTAIDRENESAIWLLIDANNRAWLLARAGDSSEALEVAREVAADIMDAEYPELLLAFGETVFEVLVGAGQLELAATVRGAVSATRERIGIVLDPRTDGFLERLAETSRAALSPEQWDRKLQHGHTMTVEEALHQL